MPYVIPRFDSMEKSLKEDLICRIFVFIYLCVMKLNRVVKYVTLQFISNLTIARKKKCIISNIKDKNRPYSKAQTFATSKYSLIFGRYRLLFCEIYLGKIVLNSCKYFIPRWKTSFILFM